MLELPIPGMIPVMGFVILAVMHTDLVVFVFRIILIVSLVVSLVLWYRRRRRQYCASGGTDTQHDRQNPDALR
jgi:hypothetical protein